MKLASVLLIAVSYQGGTDVATLLDSLRANSADSWHLIVVNNSPEIDGDEIDRLLGAEPRARQIRSKENSGYFGGAREALTVVDPGAYEWICVLNTDLIFDPEFISRLGRIDWLQVGAIAPRILNVRSGRDQNPFMVSRPTRSDLARRRLLFHNPAFAQITIFAKAAINRLRRLRGVKPAARAFSERDVYAAHGSAIVLSRRYFDSGGTLDHPLFLYGEELYIAEECRRLGLPIVYRPDLGITHNSHAQTGVLRSRRTLQSLCEATALYEKQWHERS